MFETLLIQPLYNAFIYLIGVMPQGDVGLAIIALTLFMRAVLYPLFTSSIKTQMGMAAMQNELDDAAKKYKDKPDELARERLALMKKYGVNPLAGFGALGVQLLLIIALYFALFREGFPAVDTSLLYTFVHTPTSVVTNFFGLFNLLTPHHAALALVVGITQFFAIRLTVARTGSKPPQDASKAAAHKMQQQMMLYFMPALMAVVSYWLIGAIGLYFTISNLVSLGQEWIIRRKMQK
jgi:YidC/Oxa1 family membrane protein insertase